MVQPIARMSVQTRWPISRSGLRAIAFFFLSLTLAIGVISLPTGSPSAALSSPPAETITSDAETRAPIMVDGRVLFWVGSIDGFSAEVRAETTNEKIERSLRTTPPDEPIQVFSKRVGDLTTVRIQNNPRTSEHLLTVTEGDFISGIQPMEQAQVWEARLQSAIDQAQQERTPRYRQRATSIGIALLASAIFLHLLVQWLRRRVNRYVNQKSHAKTPKWVSHWATKTILQPFLFCLQIGVWIGALVYFSDLLPVTRFWRYRTVGFLSETLTNPIFELGDRSYSTLEFLKVLVLVIGLWIGVRTLTAILRSRLLRAMGADPEIQDAIALL
ncbi:MAG: hypothetical protein VKL39_12180, partial [Leptolyngbyaceae bacterium]|nr:hypothetical protein [Leptolyngbyaceae bacterium]